MSVTSLPHKRALGHFRNMLSAERYSVTVVPGGTAAPYDALVVQMENPGEPDSTWQIELSFLPFMDEQLEEVSILQFFAPLTVGTADEVENELNWLINCINTKLPLVGFGFVEQGKVIYFKHNAMVTNGQPTSTYQQVREIVTMIGFLVNNFRSALQSVANGEKKGREALIGNPFEQLYL
ncbi:MAG: hypothetical protein JWP00_1393 [Chloroflexi bacterium]|jgi:hypothetical protein|nr:hypothetical protein [Chloroflexota bacterium]